MGEVFTWVVGVILRPLLYRNSKVEESVRLKKGIKSKPNHPFISLPVPAFLLTRLDWNCLLQIHNDLALPA